MAGKATPGAGRVEPAHEVQRIAPQPGYLQKLSEGDTSLNELSQYRVLQRLSFVQAMSDPKRKEAYGEGATLLMPDEMLLARKGESFWIAPIFFFVEYIKWRDRRDKSSSAVVERSFDPASPIARRSRNSQHRFETYEGGPKDKPHQYRYVEHLNFASLILKPGESGNAVDPKTPCVMSFSKGEFFNGQGFSGACTRRGAPLWSQVWKMTIGDHHNKQDNHWWGLDYSVDPERPWASEAEAGDFRALHLRLLDDHRKKKLVVDQTGAEDEIDDDTPIVEAGAPPKPGDEY